MSNLQESVSSVVRSQRSVPFHFIEHEQWTGAGLPSLPSFAGRLVPDFGLDHVELGDPAQRLGG